MKIYSIPRVLCFIISISSVSSQSEGSCFGRCGQGYLRVDPCHCDYNCMSYMECCQDYKTVCTTDGSCKGRCHEGFIRGQQCDCDPGCERYGKCCPDYKDNCAKPPQHDRSSPSSQDPQVRDERDKPPEPSKKPEDQVPEDAPEDRIQKDEAVPEKAKTVPLDKKDPSQNRPTSSLSSPKKTRKRSPRRPEKKKYRKLIYPEDEDEDSYEAKASPRHKKNAPKKDKKNPKYSTSKNPRKKKRRIVVEYEDETEDANQKSPLTKNKKKLSKKTPKNPKKKKTVVKSEEEIEESEENESSSSFSSSSSSSSVKGSKKIKKLSRKNKDDDKPDPDNPDKDTGEPNSDDKDKNPEKPKGTGDDPANPDVPPKEPDQRDPDDEDKPGKPKNPKDKEGDNPEDTEKPPKEPNPKEKKKNKKTSILEVEENTDENTDANTEENASKSNQRSTKKRSPTNSKKKPRKPEDDTDVPSQNPSPSDKRKKKPNSKKTNKKKVLTIDEDEDEPSKPGKGKNPKKKPNPKDISKKKKKINSEEERQETVQSEFSSSSQSSSSHSRSKSTSRRLTGKNKKKNKNNPEEPENPLMPPKRKKDKGSLSTPEPTITDEGSGDDGSGMEFLSTTTPTTTLMVHSTTTASQTTMGKNQTEGTMNTSKSPTENPDITSEKGRLSTSNILPTKEGPEKTTNAMSPSTQSPTAEDKTTRTSISTDTPFQQSKNIKHTTAMNDLEASVIVTHSTVAGNIKDITSEPSQDDGSTVKQPEIDIVGKDVTSSVNPPSSMKMTTTETNDGKNGIENTLNPGITPLKIDSTANDVTPEEAKETSPYPISKYNTGESTAGTSRVVESTDNIVSEKDNTEDVKTTTKREDTRTFAQTTPPGVNQPLISPEATILSTENLVTFQKMISTENGKSTSVGPSSTNILYKATKPADSEHFFSTTVLDEVYRTDHFHTLAETQNVQRGLTEGSHDLPPATTDAKAANSPGFELSTEYATKRLLVSASASHTTPVTHLSDKSPSAHSGVTTDISSETSSRARLKDRITPTEMKANSILSALVTIEPSEDPKTETDKSTHREEKISRPDTMDTVETFPTGRPTFAESQNVLEKQNASQIIGETLPDTRKSLTTTADINRNSAASTVDIIFTESKSPSKTTAENNDITAASSAQSRSITQTTQIPTDRERHSTFETLRERQTSFHTTFLQTQTVGTDLTKGTVNDIDKTVGTDLTKGTVNDIDKTVGTDLTKGTVNDIDKTVGPTEVKTSSNMVITENIRQSKSVTEAASLSQTVSMPTTSHMPTVGKHLTEAITSHVGMLPTTTDVMKAIESTERTGTEKLLTPLVPDVLQNALSTLASDVSDIEDLKMTTNSIKITTEPQTGENTNKIPSPTNINNTDFISEKTISYTTTDTTSAETGKSKAQLHSTPRPIAFSTPIEEAVENRHKISTRSPNVTISKDVTSSLDVSPTGTIHKTTDALEGTPLIGTANTEKFTTQNELSLPISVEVREATQSTEDHTIPTKTTEALSVDHITTLHFIDKGSDEKTSTSMPSTIERDQLSTVGTKEPFSIERTDLTHTSKGNIITSNTVQTITLQTTDVTRQQNTDNIQSTLLPSQITAIEVSTTAENIEIGKETTATSQSSHYLSSSGRALLPTTATTNTYNMYSMTVTSHAEVSVSGSEETNQRQTEGIYDTSQMSKTPHVTMKMESLAGTTLQSPLLSDTTERPHANSIHSISLPYDLKTDPLSTVVTVAGEFEKSTESLSNDMDHGTTNVFNTKNPNETGHEKPTISAQTVKDSTSIPLTGITDNLLHLASSDKPTLSDATEFQKTDVSPTNSEIIIIKPLNETFSSETPGDGITPSVTISATLNLEKLSLTDQSIKITSNNVEEQPTVTQVVQFNEATSTRLPSDEIIHTETVTNRFDNIVTKNTGLSEIPTVTEPDRNDASYKTTHQAAAENTQKTLNVFSVKTTLFPTVRPIEDLLKTSDSTTLITVTTLASKETNTNSISNSSRLLKTTQKYNSTLPVTVSNDIVHTTLRPHYQGQVSTEQPEGTSFPIDVSANVTLVSKITGVAGSTINPTVPIVSNEEPRPTHVGTNTVAVGTEEVPLSKEPISTISEVPIVSITSDGSITFDNKEKTITVTQDTQETSPVSIIFLSGTSNHPFVSKENTIKTEFVTGDINAVQLKTGITTIVAQEPIVTTEGANGLLTTVLDKDSNADQTNAVTRRAEGTSMMTIENPKPMTTQLGSQGDTVTHSTSTIVDITTSTVVTTNRDTPTSTSFKLLDKYYTIGGTADSSRAETVSIMDTTRAQDLHTGEINTESEQRTRESIEAFSVTIKDHSLSTVLDIDTNRIKATNGPTTPHSTVSPKYSPLPHTENKKHEFEGSSTSRQDLGGSTDQNVPNLHEPSFNFTVSTLKTPQDQSTTDSSDITHTSVSRILQETTNTLSINSEPVDTTIQTLPITDNGKYITSKRATSTWHNANNPSEFTDNPLDQSTSYFMTNTNTMPFSTTATTQKSEQAQTKETITQNDITVITESTTRHSDHTISSKTTTEGPSAQPQQTLTTEQSEEEPEVSTIMSNGIQKPTPTKSVVFETTQPTDTDDTEMSTKSMLPAKTPKPIRPVEPEEMENTKTVKPPTTDPYQVCDLLKDEAIKLRISDDDLQHIIEICTEMQQKYPLVSTSSPDVKPDITDDRSIPSSYPHLITPNWNPQPGTRIIQIVEEIYRRMNSSPEVYAFTIHKPSKWLLLLNKIRSSNDPQKNLCSGQPIDGMTTLQNGSMVAFRGNYFWMLNQGGVMGSPRKITEVWGIPSPVDTVFTRCNCGGKTFFFKGPNYWRFTNDVMDQGYPKEIIKGFGGLRGTVTTVLPVAGYRTRPESVYFFRPSGTVQKYTFRQEQAKKCTKKQRPSIQYPVQSQDIQTVKYRFPRAVVRHRIQIHRTFTRQQPLGVLHDPTSVRSTWRGVPNNIISAVSLPNYKKPDGFDYYVFTKDKYYNINMSSNVAVKPPPGSEQKTSKDWYKCKE